MDEASHVILLLLAVVLGLGMLLFVRNGLFSPHFLIFAYLAVGIVVRGMYLLDDSGFEGTEFWPLVAPLVQDDFFAAYLEMLVAILIAIGTSRILARTANPIESRFLHFYAFSPEDINFRGTILTALFACIAFILALGASQGGIAQAFFVLQKQAIVFGSEVFFIRILTGVFSVAVSLLVYKISAEAETSHLRKLAVATVVLLNLTLLLLSGARGPVITQMIVLLYARNRGLNQGNIGFKTISMFGSVATLVVVGGMAMRRSAQLGIALSEAAGDSLQTAGRTISGAFPITDLYLAARHFANNAGHDYGLQFLCYLVRFVPRSLWADKPLTLGFQMREYYYGDTLSGAIPTMFGEFYIAWGRFGVVVCGVFLGWLISFLDRAYQYSQRDSKFALIYILLAGPLIFDGLRAGMEMAVFWVLYMLVTVTCFKLASRLTLTHRE